MDDCECTELLHVHVRVHVRVHEWETVNSIHFCQSQFILCVTPISECIFGN